MSHQHTDHTGKQWDLDDPATYEESWFPSDAAKAMTCDELRIRVEYEVGMSLYYMLCFHPDVDWAQPRDQIGLVTAFGKRFAAEIKGRRQDRPWLLKQLFLILDETENQC